MWLLLSLLLTTLQPGATAAEAEPAAMVLTCKGLVTLEHGGAPAKKLAVMMMLRAGDRLRAADQGEVLLMFFADGHRERVRPGSQVTVASTGSNPAEVVSRVVGPALSAPNLAGLRELGQSARTGGATLRSLPDTPPLQPLYGAAVLTDRPSFAWSAAPAESYMVQLFTDAAEPRQRRAVWQVRTRTPRLSYPSAEKSLHPGQAYYWRVVPLYRDKQGEPLCESRLLVLPRARQLALACLEPLRTSGDGDDLAFVATVYEAFEVHDEALAVCERLLQARPRDAEVLLKLAGYYDFAGRTDEARQARSRARKLQEHGPR
jgi:hypothetical protein